MGLKGLEINRAVLPVLLAILPTLEFLNLILA
ncbi:hypothetical protein D8895_12840 [Streptococcus sp. BCA20]|nr:hypothetical protein D8895_12840 [Streptococcus sp. BCA20]